MDVERVGEPVRLEALETNEVASLLQLPLVPAQGATYLEITTQKQYACTASACPPYPSSTVEWGCKGKINDCHATTYHRTS
jgi:hypothetical protein